jgi:hypothetical protein
LINTQFEKSIFTSNADILALLEQGKHAMELLLFPPLFMHPTLKKKKDKFKRVEGIVYV